jgi:CRP-like cAMP-binding protein
MIRSGAVVNFLATMRLFDDLDPDDLAVVAGQLRPKSFDPGEVMVREGETGDECFVITSGSAAVVATDLIGEEVTIATLGPGELVGEVSLLDNSPRTATVRTVGAVETLSMPRAALDRLRDSSPRLRQWLEERVHRLLIRSYLKTSSPFAHLPGEALWDLAARMHFMDAPRGTNVVREGQAGSQLFLIQAGRFRVTQRGIRQRELGSGECFGEIALLAGGRRTTTVTALTDARLLVLDKQEFDGMIAGHPELAARFAELRQIRHPAAAGPWTFLPDPVSTLMPFLTARRRRTYLKFIASGTIATLVLVILANAQRSVLYLLLGLIIGSLIGPVAYVLYIVESQLLPSRRRTLLLVFLLGGFVAPIVAIVLQGPLGSVNPLNISLPQALWIGVSEEAAKGLAILGFLRRRTYRFEVDGLIFGAAAGMGFAAIESLGYALKFLAKEGVQSSVEVLVLRGLLSPFGHGTWTAILGAAIWKASRSSAPGGGMRVATAFATVVLLHAVWDANLGFHHLIQLVIVSVVGLLVLRQTFRRSLQEQAFSILALDPRLGGKPVRPGLPCRVCSQLSLPGAHYCARCGATLKRPSAVATAAAIAPRNVA